MLGWLRAEQGPLTITRFRTQKAALLLARLALFPRRTHSREELADLLWPEAELEAGRNSLKQSLASLRRQLEPPGTPSGSVLIADRATIRLNPEAFSTDVAEFEMALKAAACARAGERTAHLRRAEALYCGELLPGSYDDWVIEERERLTAQMEEVRDWLEQGDAPADSVPAESVPAAPAEPPAARLADPQPVRLPLQFTRFFGRTEEQAKLCALLRDPNTRLVTLTGPGGTGKTRLAIEVARQIAPEFGGRVDFIALADLSEPARIIEAIADTLGLPRDSARDSWEQVTEALSRQPALLLLDNLEQMADGAAPSLLALLTRLPQLTLLATSRQRLFVPGEREFPLSPLPTPDGEVTPEHLLTFPGIQLFADRAQAARPDFQVTSRSAGAVADICRHLEGIPLALELAAAWSQALTPAQMRERLTERFGLLVSRRKGVTERHQTLWKTMAWSYDLLPPELAQFWAKLSVFRGGWTEAAAAEVCGETTVLEALGRLRARTLIVTEDSGAEMRGRLLETLREFAWAQMSASAQKALADCHTRFFLAMAEEAEPRLTGPDSAQWLNRLAADQENLRAALGPDRDPALRLGIAGALWRFWAIRGPLSEGRLFLESALQDAGPGHDADRLPQAKALNGLAILRRRQGDMTAARDAHQRSLALWRLIGDPRGIASSLNNLGTLATLEGKYAEAEPALRESLGLWRSLEKPVAVAETLNNLGFLAYEQGRLVDARQTCTESLALFRGQGNKYGTTLSLSILAMICADEGNHAEARAHCRENFVLVEELQDPQTAVGCLELLARIACARGEWEHAARLLGSACTLREQIGSYQDKRAQDIAGGLLEETRRTLPPPVFEAEWAAGQAMTLNEAIAEALRGC